MRSITLADAERQVALSVGESVDVVLAGNPTTGYQWKVARLDTSIVKQIGEADYKPSSSAVGAGGHFTFQFRAVSAGQTPLKLVYLRPFEKDAPPVQTFEVIILVK
jgi:predicted secreted protein